VAVVFEGELKVMLNRHRHMGDGIVLHFPDGIIIFSNTADKYSLQMKTGLLGSDFESVTDAYIAAQVHLGKLQLKDGMYEPCS
jgi:hypothetical protein